MPAELTAGATLRWARAAVLAMVAVTFAGAAHVAAGGLLPGPAGLSLLSLLTTAVLAAVLGRPASTGRIVTLLAGGQGALHAVFTAPSGHPGALGAGVSQRPPTVRLAIPHGGIADALGAARLPARATTGPGPIETWLQHLTADLTTPENLRMAAGHAAAAALLGLWMAAGERLVWRLVVLLGGPTTRALATAAALLRGRYPRPPAVQMPAVGHLAAGRWPDLQPQRALLLAQARVRRGPPAFAR